MPQRNKYFISKMPVNTCQKIDGVELRAVRATAYRLQDVTGRRFLVKPRGNGVIVERYK